MRIDQMDSRQVNQRLTPISHNQYAYVARLIDTNVLKWYDLPCLFVRCQLGKPRNIG